MDYLNKLFKEWSYPMASMSLVYLLEEGFEKVKNITDDDLLEFKKTLEETEKENEKNGVISLLTPDFQVDMVKNARTIAIHYSPIEVIQWCEVNKPYDTKGIKKIK